MKNVASKDRKEGRKGSSLTREQRKHFEESIRHNHELMKRLAQM
jgi:hypothetical protein